MGNQSRDQNSTGAEQNTLKVTMPIRCNSLQGFQQHRHQHEGSAYYERSWPNEPESHCEYEIPDYMVDLPTKTGAVLQFRRAEGGE